MPAELTAQRGDGLHLRGVLLPRGEAREERGCEHRHRHGVLDPLDERPAPLAGVGRVLADALQVRRLFEGLDHEVEQPRPDDGAPGPRLEGAGDVGDDVLGLEQLPALGVGVHQPVLDAVVDHLRVVTCADAARVREALLARPLGSQRVEDRHRARDVLVAATGHEAVAVLQAPDATAHAAVDVVDPLLDEGGRVALVVLVVGVAAVDDEITVVEQLLERLDGLPRRIPVRDHDPHDAGRLEASDHLLQRGDIRDVGVAVVPDDLVAGAADPLPHVVAHLAQADQSELHREPFPE